MTVLPNPRLMMLLCLNILCIPFHMLGYEWCVHTHPYMDFCPEQQRWSVYGSAQRDFPNQPETASPQSLLFPLPPGGMEGAGEAARLWVVLYHSHLWLVPRFFSSQSTCCQHPCHSRDHLLSAGCILGRQHAIPAPRALLNSLSFLGKLHPKYPMASLAKGWSSVNEYLCDSPVIYSPGQSWHSALMKS